MKIIFLLSFLCSTVFGASSAFNFSQLGIGSGIQAPRDYFVADTGNGAGSTNTYARRFSNIRVQSGNGTAYTYTDSATLGASWTILKQGTWCAKWADRRSAGIMTLGISVNADTTQGLTTIAAAANAYANGYRGMTGASAANQTTDSWCLFLTAGTILRAHLSDTTNLTTEEATQFSLTRITD